MALLLRRDDAAGTLTQGGQDLIKKLGLTMQVRPGQHFAPDQSSWGPGRERSGRQATLFQGFFLILDVPGCERVVPPWLSPSSSFTQRMLGVVAQVCTWFAFPFFP